MNIDKYRLDGRTVDQFKEDVKRGTKREKEAIDLFEDFLYWEHGWIEPILENGVDMSGDFIEDVSKVTAQADFIVGGMPLEVKTCPNHTRVIYIKVNQVKSYIKQGASLLFVNGIDRRDPAFTLWTCEDLKRFESTCPKVRPPQGICGGKLCYKFNVNEVPFLTFDGKEKKY